MKIWPIFVVRLNYNNWVFRFFRWWLQCELMAAIWTQANYSTFICACNSPWASIWQNQNEVFSNSSNHNMTNQKTILNLDHKNAEFKFSKNITNHSLIAQFTVWIDLVLLKQVVKQLADTLQQSTSSGTDSSTDVPLKESPYSYKNPVFAEQIALHFNKSLDRVWTAIDRRYGTQMTHYVNRLSGRMS